MLIVYYVSLKKKKRKLGDAGAVVGAKVLKNKKLLSFDGDEEDGEPLETEKPAKVWG